MGAMQLPSAMLLVEPVNHRGCYLTHLKKVQCRERDCFASFETLQAVSPVSSSGLPTFQAWLGTARDCRLPTAIEKTQASSGSTSNTLPTRPNLSTADATCLILCLSLFENQHKPPENLSWSLDMWAGHFTCLTDWLLL